MESYLDKEAKIIDKKNILILLFNIRNITHNTMKGYIYSMEAF